MQSRTYYSISFVTISRISVFCLNLFLFFFFFSQFILLINLYRRYLHCSTFRTFRVSSPLIWPVLDYGNYLFRDIKINVETIIETSENEKKKKAIPNSCYNYTKYR